MGQDRRRLGAIFGEAGAHRFLIVVGAALELGRSADVADAGHGRHLVIVAIGGVADGAGEAARYPVDSWTIFRRSTSRLAWVPLPAPGGPRRMMFISASRRPSASPS